MKKEITDIIKNGSKAKVIELAINSSDDFTGEINENTDEYIRESILQPQEIDAIRDRARRDGWDGELDRATKKAKDINSMASEIGLRLFKAMYYLREYLAQIHSNNEVLLLLTGRYLQDWDYEEEIYKNISSVTGEELKNEITALIKPFKSTGYGVGLLDVFVSMAHIITKDDEVRNIKDRGGKALKLYQYHFKEIKVAFCGMLKAKINGYRLYTKKDYNNVYIDFTFFNESIVIEVINSLDELNYLVGQLEKYKPEILTILKDVNYYTPTKEKLEEDIEFFNEDVVINLPNEKLKKYSDKMRGLKDKPVEERIKLKDELDKEKEKVLISEEYLLKGIPEKQKRVLEKSIEILKEWVIKGK